MRLECATALADAPQTAILEARVLAQHHADERARQLLGCLDSV